MNYAPMGGLLLAAGESRRMGRDKALLDYRGRPFLEIILGHLRSAGVARPVVVLGHHADEIRSAVDLSDAEVVVNDDYRLGQTSSLQTGLRRIESSQVTGALLCLVDHPAAPVTVMRQLQDAFRKTGAPVVIPVHEKRRGHPVLIGRALFAELLGLDLSQGADTVIRKYRDAACFVETGEPGILLDIDAPEDYQRLL